MCRSSSRCLVSIVCVGGLRAPGQLLGSVGVSGLFRPLRCQGRYYLSSGDSLRASSGHSLGGTVREGCVQLALKRDCRVAQGSQLARHFPVSSGLAMG